MYIVFKRNGNNYPSILAEYYEEHVDEMEMFFITENLEDAKKFVSDNKDWEYKEIELYRIYSNEVK